MNIRPNIPATPPKPFWQQLTKILVIDTAVVLLGAALLQNAAQISNLYFYSSIIFFIIATIPIFSEVGGSAKIAGRAIKDGENVSHLLKEKQPIYEKGAKITYLYGSAGIITFLLSMLFLSLD